MLQPLRRDTWAPIGRVPVRYAWDRHDRISAVCALTIAPWADRFGLYYNLQSGNFHTPDVVGFVRHIHQHLRRPIVLIWEGIVSLVREITRLFGHFSRCPGRKVWEGMLRAS